MIFKIDITYHNQYKTENTLKRQAVKASSLHLSPVTPPCHSAATTALATFVGCFICDSENAGSGVPPTYHLLVFDEVMQPPQGKDSEEIISTEQPVSQADHRVDVGQPLDHWTLEQLKAPRPQPHK